MSQLPSDWPSGPSTQRQFLTMDGSLPANCLVQRPDRYAYFRQTASVRPAIPRGAGLSFAAASFGAGAISVDMSRFDRILGFDPASATVEVESGITLAALFSFLIPRGYYLPVQPGYGAFSIGGCIGPDVHGKNPARDGTFSDQIDEFILFHPTHGLVRVSRDLEPELFHATCGGFGLTGIVISARLRLRRLPSLVAETVTHAVPNAIEGATILRDLSESSDLIYGWHDFSCPDSRFGRGYVICGRFVGDALAGDGGDFPIPERGKLSPKRPVPISLMNKWTGRIMNTVYSRSLRRLDGTRTSNLFSFMFPIHGRELYFHLFGRKGHHEVQVILPIDCYGDYVSFLRDTIQRFRVPITLGITKLFSGRNELLRFNGDGISMAINIPRMKRSDIFLSELDRFVAQAGGRPNIIKDSRLPRSVFEATYPECDRFRAIRRAWDPSVCFRSELSVRLGL